MKASLIKLALKSLIAAKQPVYLWGAPGIGKNGFQVLKISTDLMLCHDCEKLYIVFPHGRYKGKPKGLPKPMSIAIDMDIEKEIEGMILQYKINKAMYEHIIGDK